MAKSPLFSTVMQDDNKIIVFHLDQYGIATLIDFVATA